MPLSDKELMDTGKSARGIIPCARCLSCQLGHAPILCEGLPALKVTPISRRYYKMDAGTRGFANIQKRADGWHVEIRDQHGDLKRYAGIWKTHHDGEREAAVVLLDGGRYATVNRVLGSTMARGK